MADIAKEQAFVGFSGDDDRGARITAFLPAGLGVEGEAAFQFLRLGAMAFVAVLGERRADLLFEESDASRVVGGDAAAGGEQGEGEAQAAHARTGLITWPWTSVKRRFTPLW